jgi:hypothetical protein
MNEGKNIQISRSRGLLSWFWHDSFLLQTSPFLFFPYICCVVNYYFIIYFQRVLFSLLLTALDKLKNKSALFLNDLQFIFG